VDILRDLLSWRSLRWKIAALVAMASCAIALTVGVLVHRSTLARSLNDGRAKAVTQLSRDLQDHGRDAAPPDSLQMSPEAMPAELRRLRGPQGLRDGYATWYDGDGPGDHPSMWAAQTYRGSPVAVEVDMTPDLLTRRALDRHMWKYSLVALAVVVPLSALAAELPNGRLRRVARTARRIAAGDLAARTAAGRGSDRTPPPDATAASDAGPGRRPQSPTRPGRPGPGHRAATKPRAAAHRAGQPLRRQQGHHPPHHQRDPAADGPARTHPGPPPAAHLNTVAGLPVHAAAHGVTLTTETAATCCFFMGP